LEIELILLRRNHYPLKKLPTLIWVSEFKFVSSLSFDQCLARLGSVFRNEAKGQNMVVYEISVQKEIICFAASKSFRVGRRHGTEADLGGMVKFSASDEKAHVYCYAGENIIRPTFSLLLFVLLVVGFNMFYFRTTIEIVGILSLIAFIPTVIGTIFSMGTKAALKEDIVQLFRDGLQSPKHPLTP
jgi:hypothetical protein